MRTILMLASVALLLAGCAAQRVAEQEAPAVVAAAEPADVVRSDVPPRPADGAPRQTPVPQNLERAQGAGARDVVMRSTRDFNRDVNEESRRQPVLVGFWASWCAPCVRFNPVLEKTVRAAKGRARLVMINVDQHPSTSRQFEIKSVPTIIAFSNGSAIDRIVGLRSEGEVTAFVERVASARVGGRQ